MCMQTDKRPARKTTAVGMMPMGVKAKVGSVVSTRSPAALKKAGIQVFFTGRMLAASLQQQVGLVANNKAK